MCAAPRRASRFLDPARTWAQRADRCHGKGQLCTLVCHRRRAAVRRPLPRTGMRKSAEGAALPCHRALTPARLLTAFRPAARRLLLKTRHARRRPERVAAMPKSAHARTFAKAQRPTARQLFSRRTRHARRLRERGPGESGLLPCHRAHAFPHLLPARSRATGRLPTVGPAVCTWVQRGVSALSGRSRPLVC